MTTKRLLREHRAIGQTQPIDLAFSAPGPGAEISDRDGRGLESLRPVTAEEVKAAVLRDREHL
jgi:hypothetical protein